MKGSTFKRCTVCNRVVKYRKCTNCGSTSWSWGYIVDVGKDGGGNRRQQRRTGFESEAEAKVALQELMTALAAGSYVEPTTMTLAEYLRDQWLPAVKPPKLRRTTWVGYRRIVETRIAPRIGGVRLQEVNPTHLNRLYADMLENGRVDRTGGLSLKSVRETHVVLRKALSDAVRWGFVQRNPAESADPPPAHAAAAARRRAIRVWSAEELGRFLRHVRDDEQYPLWLLLASTGMRRGEALGLPWRDLDLESGRLAVRQSLLCIDGDPRIEEPKSRYSIRTIDLDARTVAALKGRHAEQDRDRRAAGKDWTDNGLVFTRDHGVWLNPDWMSERFHRLSEEAGVPSIRMHDLRHTHATLLLRQGINVKVVSERLGHHSVAFTLDTYAHVVPGMQREAAKAFGDLLPNLDEVDDDDDNGSAGVPAVV